MRTGRRRPRTAWPEALHLSILHYHFGWPSSDGSCRIFLTYFIRGAVVAVERKWPVIIVGAGPAGLTAALTLARHNVDSLVLQKETDIVRVGSRAIVTLKNSLETFNTIATGVGTE